MESPKDGFFDDFRAERPGVKFSAPKPIRLSCSRIAFGNEVAKRSCKLTVTLSRQRLEKMELSFTARLSAALMLRSFVPDDVTHFATFEPHDDDRAGRKRFIALQVKGGVAWARRTKEYDPDARTNERGRKFIVCEIDDDETYDAWSSALAGLQQDELIANLHREIQREDSDEYLIAFAMADDPGGSAADAGGGDRGDGAARAGPATRTRGHGKRKDRAIDVDEAAAESDRVLFVYPDRHAIDAVAITEGDVDRLSPGEFLNDNLINFYFKRMMAPAASPHAPSRAPRDDKVHVFSTFFFTKLIEAEDELHEDDAARFDSAYAKVRRWSRGVDLFEKDFLLVPINEHLHWSLAVICYPGATPAANPPRQGRLRGGASRVRVDDDDDEFGGGAPAGGAAADGDDYDLEVVGAPDSEVAADGPSSEDGADGVAASLHDAHGTGGSEPAGGLRAVRKAEAKPTATDSLQSLPEPATASSPVVPSDADTAADASGAAAKSEVIDIADSDDEASVEAAPPPRVLRRAATRWWRAKARIAGAAAAPMLVNEDSGGGGDDDDEAAARADEEARGPNVPCILFMDSLRAHAHSRICKYLRAYLEREWAARRAPGGADEPAHARREFSPSTMPTIEPEVPTQNNSCDCGVCVHTLSPS